MSRSRSWQFTVNNFTDSDLTRLAQVECVYIVYGKEVAPTTGTPHLQGFVMFENPVRMSTVSDCIPGHLSPVSNKPWCVAEYCKKDGDFTERGTAPKNPGKRERNDWDGYMDLIKSGRATELPDRVQITQFRNIQAIEAKYRKIDSTLDWTTPPNEWLWGEKGSGKSTKARLDNPGFYWKMSNQWWDGYSGEDTVLLEDITKDWPQFASHLLIWADRFSFRGATKGSTLMLRPKKIVVTSNYSIQELCDQCGILSDTCLALQRRFREIRVKGRVEECD